MRSDLDPGLGVWGRVPELAVGRDLVSGEGLTRELGGVASS